MSAATADEAVINVSDLRMHFPGHSSASRVKAVDGVSFDVMRGETLGLVGETGSGKTTTGRAILQLYKPTGGSVRYEGLELTGLNKRAMRRSRTHMQMIFQDPHTSLDPRMTVGNTIAEPLKVHGIADKSDRPERVQELLQLVGLSPQMAYRYPHELSVGQRQRIGIARALAVRPDFVVCDEPVSGLDMSGQALIVNLLIDLQEQLNLSYLFIAHDLLLVRSICDRVGVMYLGKLMELADRADLYAEPLHPYTKALLSAAPSINRDLTRNRERIVLSGEIPSPADPPSGCVFRTRCPHSMPVCEQKVPSWRNVEAGGGRRWVACHLV